MWAVIPAGKHLFPFRTEQLSPPGPMVLGGQPPGRVGRRPIPSLHDAAPLRGAAVARWDSARGARWACSAPLNGRVEAAEPSLPRCRSFVARAVSLGLRPLR